jgi:hypothetical protein
VQMFIHCFSVFQGDRMARGTLNFPYNKVLYNCRNSLVLQPSFEQSAQFPVGRILFPPLADVEIMVDPGNLVPKQKPRVAAIFWENSRIMSYL